jgi:hypothetical protein
VFRLLIERKGRKPQVFPLRRESTSIGRGKDTNLLLPDISVSRHHATLQQLDADTYGIIDEGSQNGTKVNGKPIKKRKLKSGDQIQIGKFLIVFERQVARTVEESRGVQHDEYSVDGERTGYLRKVSAVDGEGAHSTTQLSPEELVEMRKQIRLVEHGRIELLHEPQNSWLIGSKGLRFGTGGVPAKGMGIGGSVEIQWTGKVHEVQKTGGIFLSVKLNGKELKKATPISTGDLLVVGKPPSDIAYRWFLDADYCLGCC